jgi:hypothetical protein
MTFNVRENIYFESLEINGEGKEEEIRNGVNIGVLSI